MPLQPGRRADAGPARRPARGRPADPGGAGGGLSGRPLAGADVTVAQRRHASGSGCTGFELVPLANGELPHEEVLAAQLDRIRREVSGFAGVVDTWDVIDEVVIMPVFDEDDNGITRIDALGLQSHMHQGCWGEERQAQEVERHYRTLLSHPAVEAATYRGLSDAGAWLGAPGGLVRADGTPKPSYEALRNLVRGEWWLAPTTVRTDEAGRVPVAGFAGEYELATPHGTAAFELVAGSAQVTARPLAD